MLTQAEREALLTPQLLARAEKVAARICNHYGYKREVMDARSAAWAKLWKWAMKYDPAQHDNFELLVRNVPEQATRDYLRTLPGFRTRIAPIKEFLFSDLQFRPDRVSEKQSDGLIQNMEAYLPQRYADCLRLLYWEQWTLLEVASLLGVGEGRVSQIKHAALKKLREAMNG